MKLLRKYVRDQHSEWPRDSTSLTDNRTNTSDSELTLCAQGCHFGSFAFTGCDGTGQNHF